MNLVPALYSWSLMAGVIAFGAFLLIHRVMKPVDLDQHQGFLDAMLSIVGTLVSILLGLLVAASLDHYRTLEQNVDAEAATVVNVFRLSGGLPQQFGEEVRQLCIQYCDQVIHDEWPAMAKGDQSNKLLLTSATLARTVVTFSPTTNGETNIHSALLSSLEQLSSCRRQRLLATHDPWKKQLLPVLIMCTIIVLTFAFLYGRKGAILHGAVICLVAIALGANLALMELLNNPFSGDWSIQPNAFEYNVELLQRFRSTPELRKFAQP
ncbi:MAG TPA: hypothetical protein V6D22_13205 [Candidatus Obscuribacterales bacterium]